MVGCWLWGHLLLVGRWGKMCSHWIKVDFYCKTHAQLNNCLFLAGTHTLSSRLPHISERKGWHESFFHDSLNNWTQAARDQLALPLAVWLTVAGVKSLIHLHFGSVKFPCLYPISLLRWALSVSFHTLPLRLHSAWLDTMDKYLWFSLCHPT